MMPDITFINLPTPYLEDPLWIYPLGLVSLVTYVRSLKINAEILDLGPEPDISFSNITSILRGVHSPVIGVSVVTPGARYLPLFVAANRFNHRKLVAGGPHVTCLSNEVLNIGFSTVVRGEGESTIGALMHPDQGGTLSGEPIELDELPFPDRSLVKGYKGPAAIMTSRGCPFSCTFCSKSGMKYRRRSPLNVVEEVESIDNSHIIFYDDTFTASHPWLVEFCELILLKKIKKTFRCSTRADRVDLSILKLMKKTGFDEICVGVESGSQKILDTLNKKITVEENSRARKISLEVGLKFKAYIMIGSPGESWNTIKETIQWLDDNKPDSVGLYIYHPLPGSDIWHHPEKYDIKFSTDYDSSYYGGRREEMTSTVSTSSLSKKEITEFYWKILERIGNAKTQSC